MLKTQFISAQWKDGTFTDEAQLATNLLISPSLQNNVALAFLNEGKGNKYGILQGLTQGLGRIGKPDKSYKVLGNNEYQWALMGVEQRAVPITGPSTPEPNANVGINFSLFTVPLAEKYLTLGDTVLFGGGMPDQVYARVMEEPFRQGNNWCYTFQILGNNPNEFVNPQYLQVGKEVGWIGSAFEEGSEGGGMKTSTPMWFKNQMGIQRMAWGMTGSAKNSVMVLRFETHKGKTDLWAYKAQWECLQQWNKMQERELWFSRYNRLSDDTFPNYGANGRVIKRGSGVEEQITGANTYVTSQLTEELLRYMLLDIMRCQGDASNVKRLLFTGSGGLVEFDKAMRNALAGTVTVTDGAYFIHKKTGNELAFGSQFTTYRGFLGTEFTVVYHPLFDDKTVFTELHPVTGFTMQSYKMYFLDFSDYGGEPNIQMVTRGANGESRSLIQWFTAGGTTPHFNGNVGLEAMRSNGFDGFMCYTLSETGIMILNPLSCGMIQILPPV